MDHSLEKIYRNNPFIWVEATFEICTQAHPVLMTGTSAQDTGQLLKGMGAHAICSMYVSRDDYVVYDSIDNSGVAWVFRPNYHHNCRFPRVVY